MLKQLPCNAVLDANRPVSEDVANKLKAKILSGKLNPGDQLSERKLARDFSTSRQPVHDALNVLEGQRLVVRVPGKGMFVASHEPGYLSDFFVVREELEALAARLACRNVSAGADPCDLRRLLEENKAAILAGDNETAYRTNEEFHFAIMSLADNDFLASVLNPILMQMHYWLAGFAPNLAMVYSEHVGLYEAISTGDVSAADALSRKHATPFKNRLVAEAEDGSASENTAGVGRDLADDKGLENGLRVL